MALTNTAATLPGFIVPVFVGEMTHGNVTNSNRIHFITQLVIVILSIDQMILQQSLERWQIIFGTTAAVFIVELVLFLVLASGEEQPWNRAYTSGDLHKTEAGLEPEHEKLRPQCNK